MKNKISIIINKKITVHLYFTTEIFYNNSIVLNKIFNYSNKIKK